MAKLLPNLLSFQFITLFFFISITTISSSQPTYTFIKALNPKKHGLKKEKLSHFRVFWHDIVSGPKPTAVPVINGSTSSGFGAINMIDDPLTETPELSSKLIGRAQGLYALASQQEIGLLMAMNFYFVEGKYNGSTITVLGRNTVVNKVREMPVIGGSGLFRYARGYVQARTYSLDIKTGDACVEYNVYVMHY